MQKSYDIFISYRHVGGAQYARILQLMLIQRGYEAFLDYDELTDGILGDHIKDAIKSSSVFILILSEGALDRCVNEDDWVRQEIELAVSEGKHIIPVNPDDVFDGMPDEVPAHIRAVANDHYRSEIYFGQTLGVTVDFMVEKRIVPVIGDRNRRVDVEVAPPSVTPKRPPALKKYLSVLVSLALLLSFCLVFYIIRHQKRMSLMTDAVFDGMYLYWCEDITIRQLEAVHEILGHMESLAGGTFLMGAAMSDDGNYDVGVDPKLETPQVICSVEPYHISKYEVTVGQWGRIMKERYDKGQAALPKTEVTLSDCRDFVQTLTALTGLPFAIPTETEWEYAARGGDSPDGTRYSGSNDPAKVAWYVRNSGARPHACDARLSGMDANGADLFDMSGNVSEWCDTPFRLYIDLAKVENADVEILNPDNMVMRGGNYLSERYELTVTHRDPVPAYTSLSTLGFRLIIRK